MDWSSAASISGVASEEGQRKESIVMSRCKLVKQTL